LLLNLATLAKSNGPGKSGVSDAPVLPIAKRTKIDPPVLARLSSQNVLETCANTGGLKINPSLSNHVVCSVETGRSDGDV
jgi:hypothetical protein